MPIPDSIRARIIGQRIVAITTYEGAEGFYNEEFGEVRADFVELENGVKLEIGDECLILRETEAEHA